MAKAKLRINDRVDSYQVTLRSIYEAEGDKVAGMQAAFAAEVSSLPSFFVDVISDMAEDIEQDLGMIAVVSGRESEMALERMRSTVSSIASSLDSLKGRVLQERLLIQKRNRLRDATLEVIETMEGEISAARDGVLRLEIAPRAVPYRGQSIDLAQDIRGDMMRRYSAERGFGIFLEEGKAAPYLLGGEASSDPGFRAWSMEGLDQMEVALHEALGTMEKEVEKADPRPGRLAGSGQDGTGGAGRRYGKNSVRGPPDRPPPPGRHQGLGGALGRLAQGRRASRGAPIWRGSWPPGTPCYAA